MCRLSNHPAGSDAPIPSSFCPVPQLPRCPWPVWKRGVFSVMLSVFLLKEKWKDDRNVYAHTHLSTRISPFYSEIFLYAFASCPLLKLFKDRSSEQNFRSVPDILYQSPKRCFCNVYKSVYSMSLSVQLFVWHVHLLPRPRKPIVSQKSVHFYSMSKRGNVCRNMQFRGVWEVLVYRTSRFRICWSEKNRDHFFFFHINA